MTISVGKIHGLLLLYYSTSYANALYKTADKRQYNQPFEPTPEKRI